jgi:hypothetical protein
MLKNIEEIFRKAHAVVGNENATVEDFSQHLDVLSQIHLHEPVHIGHRIILVTDLKEKLVNKIKILIPKVIDYEQAANLKRVLDKHEIDCKDFRSDRFKLEELILNLKNTP